MKKLHYESWQAKLLALELANEVGKGIIGRLIVTGMTASQLSEAMEIPLSTVLFHVQRLEEAGLVVSKKALGKRLREVKVYSVPTDEIVIKIGGNEHE